MKCIFIVFLFCFIECFKTCRFDPNQFCPDIKRKRKYPLVDYTTSVEWIAVIIIVSVIEVVSIVEVISIV